MRLNHNLAALNIYREHTKTVKGQSASVAKISSGNKVNSAGDNPNAMAQSERLRIQIRGLQMAQRNAQDGMSMLQTAEGGLNNVTSALQRIKELTVQAGGANSSDDKAIIQGEIDQLISGINDTVKNTVFNGVRLIGDDAVVNNSNPKVINMPSGANVDERVEIPVFNLSADKIGDEANGKYLINIDITKDDGIGEALNIIDKALTTVLSVSSKYGALENRFEGVYNMTSAIGQNVQKAESDLRDADLAFEMMNYAKNNLLMEAGNSMMAQANRFPQDILRILENVK